MVSQSRVFGCVIAAQWAAQLGSRLSGTVARQQARNPCGRGSSACCENGVCDGRENAWARATNRTPTERSAVVAAPQEREKSGFIARHWHALVNILLRILELLKQQTSGTLRGAAFF
eukprot:TRINITY_DN69621_c1_g1_i3.p1 TRINITY_DN69621_c1_g1~~TRINITY_DN69621_c1_g1_i3.p1  ORF type:complete len:117 (+),score=3.15 TRINITY_DN69621_c1_g1_i3:153-503(+)